MEEYEIKRLIDRQKKFFATGVTLPTAHRVAALRRLKSKLAEMEPELCRAIAHDLGKSHFESFMCEIGLVNGELDHMIRHTKKYASDRRVPTPLAQLPARSFVHSSPYGTVLIMSPWNYPVLLTLQPLIDAIAAGNTAIVKPSAYSPATSAALKKLLDACFPPEYVAVVTGGRAENQSLFTQKFDYIFFTGSVHVGKEVMRSAAEHLTPVTLELGGKSPCIVDETAHIRLAARRIVFGKFINCGQTCVAPDYILCQESVHDKLVSALKEELVRQYGRHPIENKDYGKIVNRKQFDRICGLISDEKVVYGGRMDENSLQIEPTILDRVTWEDAVMKEEIFGPVLPILTYQSIEEVIASVNSHPCPLALYYFSEDKKRAKRILAECSFGGGCINDTIIHLATDQMPFGGVGESGMGCYHGKKGFETFSHEKSVVNKATWMDMPIRYQPYTDIKEKLVHLFL